MRKELDEIRKSYEKAILSNDKMGLNQEKELRRIEAREELLKVNKKNFE